MGDGDEAPEVSALSSFQVSFSDQSLEAIPGGFKQFLFSPLFGEMIQFA